MRNKENPKVKLNEGSKSYRIVVDGETLGLLIRVTGERAEEAKEMFQAVYPKSSVTKREWK